VPYSFPSGSPTNPPEKRGKKMSRTNFETAIRKAIRNEMLRKGHLLVAINFVLDNYDFSMESQLNHFEDQIRSASAVLEA
jgi:hypothetical protein